MAFPKTQSGTDPMLEAPSVPEPGQYEELGLRFVGVPGEGGVRRDPLSVGTGPLDWFAQRPAHSPRCSARSCIAFSGIFYR